MLEDTSNYKLRPVGRWAIYTALAVLPLPAIFVLLAVRDGMALRSILPTLLILEAAVCVFPAAIAMFASFPCLVAKRTRGIGANLMVYGAWLGAIAFGSYLLSSLLSYLGMGQV